jgi:hypothetical protein
MKKSSRDLTPTPARITARARGISRLDTVNDAPENSKTDFGRHLDGNTV